MGLNNNINSWFEKLIGGFKLGTQTESMSVKGVFEMDSNGNTTTHTFPNRDGNVVLEDEVIPTDETGTVITFVRPKTYGTADAPSTGNITESFAGARKGVIQKIYHEEGTEPTFPAGWVMLGTNEYSTDGLNIIYAEWCGGTRVEYWVISFASELILGPDMTWTKITTGLPDTINSWLRVGVANDKIFLMSVTSSGAGLLCAYSTTGLAGSWTLTGPATRPVCNNVSYSPSLGRYILGSSTTSSSVKNNVWWSDDLVTWTAATGADACGRTSGLSWLADAGKFVMNIDIHANDAGLRNLFYSSDGKVWTSNYQSSMPGPGTGVPMRVDGGLCYGVTAWANQVFYTSNGVDWTFESITGHSGFIGWAGIQYGRGTYFGVGSQGTNRKLLGTALNSIVASNDTNLTAATVLHPCYTGGASGTFVFLQNTGANKIWQSRDGGLTLESNGSAVKYTEATGNSQVVYVPLINRCIATISGVNLGYYLSDPIV